MALSFENTIDEWKNEGTEPSDSLKESGFTAGYKPPASVFNWFWNKISKMGCEIQNKLSSEDDLINSPPTASVVNALSNNFIIKFTVTDYIIRTSGQYDGQTNMQFNVSPSIPYTLFKKMLGDNDIVFGTNSDFNIGVINYTTSNTYDLSSLCIIYDVSTGLIKSATMGVNTETDADKFALGDVYTVNFGSEGWKTYLLSIFELYTQEEVDKLVSNVDIDTSDFLSKSAGGEVSGDVDFTGGISENGTALEDRYALISEAGYSLNLSINTTDYIMTLSLLNKSGAVLSTKTIDFPLESMVVGASYADGDITLTLQNGNTTSFSVADLVSGLVSESRKIADIDLKDDITAAELLSALGIEEGANKTVIDTELNESSNNAVANSAVAAAVLGLKTKLYVKADDTDSYGTFNTADGEVYESFGEAWSASYSGCEIILLPGTHVYTTSSYFSIQKDGIIIKGIDPCCRNITILDIQTSSSAEAFMIYGNNIHISDLTLTCSTQSSLGYFIEIAGPKDEIIFDNVYFEYPSKICIEINFSSINTWEIPVIVQNCCFKSLADGFTATVYFSNSLKTTFVFPIILRDNIELGNEFSYVERSTNYPAEIVSYNNYSVDNE